MSSNLRILVGVVALVVVALGLYWFFGRSDASDPQGNLPEVVETAPVVPTPSLQDRLSERLKGVTLAGSDAAVREVVATLSSQPELVTWMANEDLVRRFVSSVHLIADGNSPNSQLEFLKPEEKFSATQKGDSWVIDAKSYRRYDLVADSFAALDGPGMAVVFAELEPLIDEAHREIAPPGSTFRATLNRAFDQLLAVPILEGDVIVDRKVVTFTFSDERLENLSDVQRQLLRMGSGNVALIQAKIVELKADLGL